MISFHITFQKEYLSVNSKWHLETRPLVAMFFDKKRRLVSIVNFVCQRLDEAFPRLSCRFFQRSSNMRVNATSVDCATGRQIRPCKATLCHLFSLGFHKFLLQLLLLVQQWRLSPLDKEPFQIRTVVETSSQIQALSIYLDH